MLWNWLILGMLHDKGRENYAKKFAYLLPHVFATIKLFFDSIHDIFRVFSSSCCFFISPGQKMWPRSHSHPVRVLPCIRTFRSVGRTLMQWARGECTEWEVSWVPFFGVGGPFLTFLSVSAALMREWHACPGAAFRLFSGGNHKNWGNIFCLPCQLFKGKFSPSPFFFLTPTGQERIIFGPASLFSTRTCGIGLWLSAVCFPQPH